MERSKLNLKVKENILIKHKYESDTVEGDAQITL
jgi:hypothetical protein